MLNNIHTHDMRSFNQPANVLSLVSSEQNMVFCASDDETNVETMLDLAKNGNHVVLVALLNNKNCAPEVVHNIVLNTKISNSERQDIYYGVVGRLNTSAETLHHIFYDKEILDSTLLTMIAEHPNTPPTILEQFLPTEELPNRRIVFIELAAINNHNTPHKAALNAIRFMPVDYRNNLDEAWDKHFKLFVVEHKQRTGVDISDWPKEWVVEYVK